MIERFKDCISRISKIKTKVETFKNKSKEVAQCSANVRAKFNDILENEVIKTSKNTSVENNKQERNKELTKITEKFPLKMNIFDENNTENNSKNIFSNNMVSNIIDKLYEKGKNDPNIEKKIEDINKYYKQQIQERKIKNIVIISLLLIFFISIGFVTILADYFGLLNIRHKLPNFLLKYNIVRKYIKNADMLYMSPEEKLKTLRYIQINEFEDQKEELSKLQHEINLKQEELIDKQKKMESEQHIFNEKKSEFEKIQKQMEEIKNKNQVNEKDKKQKEASELLYNEQLNKLVKVYEKMDPEKAGKALELVSNNLLSDILDKMKDKNAAAIMNNISANKIAEFMSWKENQKK